MAAEELTLLGLWASPFVIRARIALNLKGLTYVYAEDSLYNKSELLLKSNPVLKKVPVLIHNGKPVCESQVIVQYIDEAFPAAAGAPILPSAPYDRAVARFWASYVEDKWFSTWLPVFSGRTAEERVEAATQVVAVLQTLEQAFKECSKGKAFFGGDTVGLGRRAWRPPWVAVRHRGHLRGKGRRRYQDAAAGGVGRAVLRAGRCEGADSGRGQACGV